MAWAFDRAHKIRTCRDNLPDQSYNTLQPLFDSDLIVLVIAAGETPGRTWELESKPNSAKGGAPKHGINVYDESAMDFTVEPLPPLAASPGIPSTSLKSAEEASVAQAGAHGTWAGHHTDIIGPMPKTPRQGLPSTPANSAIKTSTTCLGAQGGKAGYFIKNAELKQITNTNPTHRNGRSLLLAFESIM